MNVHECLDVPIPFKKEKQKNWKTCVGLTSVHPLTSQQNQRAEIRVERHDVVAPGRQKVRRNLGIFVYVTWFSRTVVAVPKNPLGFKLFSLKESINEWFSPLDYFNYSMSTRVCHRASCKHLRHEMGCPTWPSFTCATWWLTRTTQLNKGATRKSRKSYGILVYDSICTYISMLPSVQLF